MKQTLIQHDTVSDVDFDLIKLTDDIDEVVSLMKDHREWKQEQIELSKKS